MNNPGQLGPSSSIFNTNGCYDLTAILAEEQSLMGQERREEHLHLDGIIGASDAGSCNIFGAFKAAHVPMPEKTGLKAESGAMDIGTIIHEWSQAKALRANMRLPDTLRFGCEVMVKIQLTEKTWVESPIDIALASIDMMMSQDIFHQVQWQFRNEQRTVTQIDPLAKWEQIWDIKSCSDISFYKILNIGEKCVNRGTPIIPWKWIAQMHIYMKATGLKQITVLMIHKEKGWHKEIVIPWSDESWEKLIGIIKRKEELIGLLKGGAQTLMIDRSDLEYFNFGDDNVSDNNKPLCWFFCNLSETYEQIDAKGKPHLLMKKPCPYVVEELKDDCKEMLHEGDKWKWGSSHITIDRIDWDEEMVYSHNKTDEKIAKDNGTDYHGVKSCSIYAALEDFTEIPAKGDK